MLRPCVCPLPRLACVPAVPWSMPPQVSYSKLLRYRTRPQLCSRFPHRDNQFRLVPTQCISTLSAKNSTLSPRGSHSYYCCGLSSCRRFRCLTCCDWYSLYWIRLAVVTPRCFCVTAIFIVVAIQMAMMIPARTKRSMPRSWRKNRRRGPSWREWAGVLHVPNSMTRSERWQTTNIPQRGQSNLAGPPRVAARARLFLELAQGVSDPLGVLLCVCVCYKAV